MNQHVFPAFPVLPAVMSAAEVARLLRRRSVNAFLSDRRRLEAAGFPRKLPGTNLWSGPAILRWLETNGETCKPPDPDASAIAAATAALEREYAR